MARKTFDEIMDERRKKRQNYDPFGGDTRAEQRNIPFVDKEVEDIFIRRGADPGRFMDEYQKKDYNRPYHNFNLDQQQNKARQNIYDTLYKPNYGKMDLSKPFQPEPVKRPIPSQYHAPGYTPPQNRPKENATASNIPKRDYQKATQQLQDTFRTTPQVPPVRPQVTPNMAEQMRLSPMERMNELEYQTGAKRPTIDQNNIKQSIQDITRKYPHAPELGGITPVDPFEAKKNNFTREVGRKTKAFLTGVVSPIAKPISRFFENGMKTNGVLPQDGSTYNRTNNWYVENHQALIQAGYTEKDIKQMKKQDLQAAQQDDNNKFLKSVVGKSPNQELTGADQFAHMAGSVAGNVGLAIGTGQVIGAAVPTLNPIAQSAIVGGVTGATSSYGERNDIGTVAKDIARRSMFYGAGRVGSNYVGQVAGELISKYGLETSAAALYATEAVKSLAFDAAGYGATLPTYPLMGDDMPTAKDVAFDMAVGALFDIVPNMFDTNNRLKYNKAVKAHNMEAAQVRMGLVMENIKKNYDKVGEYEKTAPHDIDTLESMYDAMLNDIEYIKGMTRGQYKNVPGQEETVIKLNEMFGITEDYIQWKKESFKARREAGMDPEGPMLQGEDPYTRSNNEMGVKPKPGEVTGEGKPYQNKVTGEANPYQHKVNGEANPYPLGIDNGTTRINRGVEQEPQMPPMSTEQMHEYHKQRNDEMVEEFQGRGNTNIAPPQPRPDATLPTTYGRNGKKAFKKWGQNESVMANLDNPSDPYTQDYKRFFEAWYEAGRLGLPEYQVRVATENDFPAFLETAFYQAGKNDMEKGSPKTGTNIPRPETQEAINPITTPLKPEDAPEVGPIDRDTPSVRGEETPPSKTNTPVDIQKPLKGYELPEDYENPNYKGEYKMFGPKGEKLIGDDPNNARPYQDGVMGKKFEPEAYGIETKTAEKLYNAGLYDRDTLNYRERLIINQYQNTKGQLKRLVDMGLGDKPIVESFKKELAEYAPSYHKLDPKKFKYQSLEPTAPKVKPEEQEGYVENKKGPTIESIKKKVDHDVDWLITSKKPRMDDEEQGTFSKGLMELTRQTLKNKDYSQKSLNRKVQEYFNSNVTRFTMLNEAYNKTGKNTPQEIYEVQKPFTAQFLSERRAIRQAGKEKDIQKARYEINERIGVLEMMRPTVYAIMNPYSYSDPRYKEASDWIRTEAKEDLIREVLKKIGFSEKQIAKHETDKSDGAKVPEGYTKVEDFKNLEPGATIYDKNLEEYTFKEGSDLGNTYELKVENKNGEANYLYTNEPIYTENLSNKVNVEQVEGTPTKPKEVLEVTQAEYDAAKADYEASGKPFPPEDIELKVIDAEPETPVTKVEREAWEKEQELEAKKILNERHKEAYDYLKTYRKGKKAAVYYKSPELTGVDDLKAISNFIRFVDDKKAHKLDVLQMEMAKDFPEVSELGLEEFGQFLVDSVKAHRGNKNTNKKVANTNGTLEVTQAEDVNPRAKDLKTYQFMYEKHKEDIRGALLENTRLQENLEVDSDKAAILLVGEILDELPKYAKNFRFANAGPDEFAMHDMIFKELNTNEAFLKSFFKSKEDPMPFDSQHPTPKNEPVRVLAEDIMRFITAGTELSPGKLYEMANKAFGGTQTEGKYEIKDAHDAMELAVNLYLRENGKTFLKDDSKINYAKLNIEKLGELIAKLPSITKRSNRTDTYQQFSTPPTVAYLAAYAANMTAQDVVLEPSAGIGGLAVFADLKDARVVVNELEPKRLETLKEMGYETYNLNAEQIDNLLPEDIEPTVVIMNPPFSSAPERMGDKKATANAKRHIEQALERLVPGGRLVAIVGEGMADDAPTFKGWFNALRNDYNIRANLSLNKEAFRKYGTTFGTQLIVIDKTGAQIGETLTGKFKTLAEIPKVLEEIRNDRREIEPTTTKPGSKEVTTSTRSNGAVSTTDNGTSNTGIDTKSGQQPSNGTDEEIGTHRTNDTTKGVDVSNTTTGAGTNDSDVKPGTKTGEVGNSSTNDGKQPTRNVKVENKKQKKKVENESDVYSVYEPSKVSIKGAKPHMSDLVESAAMAAVEPPDVTYTPHLPQELIESGALSMAQLENIVYAGQAHAQKLPDGTRRGHFIGDGTGVGKGREIAGIIMDNFAQGRTKAVWFTMNQNLVVDAYRDWTELGNNKELMQDHSKIKAGTPITMGKGVLVSTYGMLKSGSKNNPKATRINQIVEWLGKDFDGVIVFDEAHNMANAIDTQGTRGKSKASQTALAGIELQRLLPNARIEYVSATGATDVYNLAYLTRLGLWGEGTAFKNVNDFIGQVGEGGLAAMELVARDMKAMGVYLSRSISFKGVEYDTLEHKINPMQKEIYDTMSEAWSIVLDNVDEALNFTGGNGNTQAVKNAKGQFYSAIQNFYNQIVTAMSMPSVINDIKKEINSGKACVIQIVNTNEAAAERQFEKMAGTGADLEELDMTPRDTLIQYLNNCFPIHEYEEYVDDNGNTRTRPVTDAAGNPVVSKKAVKKRDELIAMVEEMQVPDGPLEMLMDEFGPDMVAEVTGRKRRVVTTTDKNGNRVRQLEKRNKNSGLTDAQAFQDGKKLILVFSNAGGTGKSYHADRRAKNQRKRIHYLLQPGWNVFGATQGLGRTHRTNQVLPPTFRLVTTDIMGQKRFTSTIARRLDQLGALTKGQRDTGSGIFGEKDNLESNVAKDALAVFYKELYKDKGRQIFKQLGIEKQMFDRETGAFKPDKTIERDTGKFLNRILALKVDLQNEVFNQYMSVFDRVFDKAVADGTVDMGLENVKADKIEVAQEETIREQDGIKTNYVQLNTYTKPKLIEYKRVHKLYKNFKGVYMDTRTDEIKAIYGAGTRTNDKGEVVQHYIVQSPMMAKKSMYVQKTVDENMIPIEQGEWERSWAEETTKQPEYLEEKLHMLTGTLLPIWNLLPKGNASVKRVMTDTGETYLGRVIRPKDIDGILRRFDMKAKKETYTNEQVRDLVLTKNKLVVLDSGDKLRIARRRVSGEWRMELLGNNLYYFARQLPGIIKEKIEYKDRYFIPASEKGLEIIGKLAKIYPIVDIKDNVTKVNDEVHGMTSMRGQSHTKVHEPTGKNTDVKGTKSASQIFKAFEKQFGAAIKRRPRRGTLGTYNSREHLIRVKKANDIPVLCHETGHLLDRTYKWSEDSKAPYAKELMRLGETTSKKSYNGKQKRQEGVAEFIRLYFTEPEAAEASSFYPYFVGAMEGKELKAVDALQHEIWKLLNLSPEDSMGKAIKFYDENYKGPRKTKADWEMDLADLKRMLASELWDENYNIYWAADQMGGKGAKQTVENKVAQFRGQEGKAIFNIVGEYQADINGNKIGRSYEKITEPIRKNKKVRQAFMEYQVARRGLDYHTKKLEFPRTLETCKNVIKNLEYEYPEFKGVFDELLQYRHNELHKLVDGGIISEEDYKKIVKENPNYVPLKRDFENYKAAAGTGKKMAASRNVIKKVKGSGRDIIDPEVNDITNTFAYTSAAERNKILLKLADIAQVAKDAGHIMSKSQIPMQTIDLNRKQLEKIIGEVMAINGLGQVENLNLDVMNKIFKPNYAAAENQVIVYRGGKVELYDIHPHLYKTISGLNANQANVLIDVMNKIGRVSKTGIIFTPTYMYRNFSRDTFQSLIGSEAGITILDLVGGVWSTLTNDAHYQGYKKNGGSINFFTATDKNFLKQTLDEMKLAQKKAPTKLLNKFRHPLNTIQDIMEPLENAARVAEYKKILKKAGYNDATIAKAVNAGRDLSVDFKRCGALIKRLHLNQMINFFNPQIQGMAKDIRLLTNKRTALRTALRAIAYLTMPTLALWWLNKENENYQELSPFQRDNFFNVPIPIDGDYTKAELFIPIPKPFGLGSLFSALPERIVEKNYRDNPRAFDGFGETLAQAWGVPVIPSAFNPYFEASINQNFLGNPIINLGDQRLPGHLQYNEYTSETAKLIANMTKNLPMEEDHPLKSAKKIDHMIKGYTGTLGTIGLAGIDTAAGKERAALEPLFKGFVVDSQRRPETINRFYDYKKELDLAYAEAMLTKQAGKYFDPAIREVFTKINSKLQEIGEAKQAIEAMPNGQNKEEQLLALSKIELQLMKGATEIFEKKFRK